MISDLFGMNRRRILYGLVPCLGRDAIPDSLSRPVRDKLDRLGAALHAALSDAAHVVLGDLLLPADAVTRRIADLGQHRAAGLAPAAERPRLLRASTPSRPPRSWAHPATVLPNANLLAVSAGNPLSNHGSAGKRRDAGARAGTSHLRALLIGRAHHVLPVPRRSSGTGRPAWLQTHHRRHRPQASERDLRGAG